MHKHLVLTAVASLTMAAPVFAQTYPAEAVILQNEVEVRSGPSKNFYPTTKLFRNDKVLVLRESKEAPGWVEIKPPTGSFSWISGKYVKQVDSRYAYVDCDPAKPVPILPGSTLVNQEPNRESMKLTAGTVLVIVDRPLTINGEVWLPIQPHPSETRFLPAESVRPAQTVTTVTTTPSWTLTPNGYVGNNFLAEAEKAFKDNDINRARQLYQHVINNGADENQKAFARNRLAALSQGPYATTSQPKDESRTALSPGNVPTIPGLALLKADTWSPYGRLRDLQMKREDGQPIYAIEDAHGHILNYVTTSPGKSLQAYVGRTVSVYGPTMWRPESSVKMQYVVANYVAVP